LFVEARIEASVLQHVRINQKICHIIIV
jgi:hypothetical protein